MNTALHVTRRGAYIAACAALMVNGSLRAQSTASITGKVSTTSGSPVPGARVAVSGSDITAGTDSTGTFYLRTVPRGQQQLTVRQIGFEPATRVLSVPDSGVVSLDVTLTAIPLDTVRVQEGSIIPSFDEHRRIGLGYFLTREQLAKQENRRMADILAQVPGIHLKNGGGANVSWIYSGRRPVTSISMRSRRDLDQADLAYGADPRLCYAQVYLDQVLVYRGGDQEPLFNVNSVLPHEIHAIEYYAGPSVTPARYSRLNSQCGVLVIHTRRY